MTRINIRYEVLKFNLNTKSASITEEESHRYMARVLNKANFATFLIDHLRKEKEEIDIGTGQFKFDTDLLSLRLTSSTK